MQCRTCGYRLWNLSARRCPECGTGFLPSEYEFVPGSVRFSCLHCQQSYYGTDARGHLAPAEFVCVKCNRHVFMDEMILHPTEGLEEEQTRVDIVPWLERSRYGPVKAWFTMLGRALVGQTRLMRALPPYSSVASAWWFSLLTQFLIYTFVLLPGSLFLGYMVGTRAASLAGGLYGGFILIMLLSAFVGTVLWGLITHAILRWSGPTASTIGRTYQAICYSSGAIAVSSVPCLGIYLLWIGWLWWIISAILMIKEGQKVSAGRAALAVIVPPVLAVVLAIVGVSMAVPWSKMMFKGPAMARMTARATAQSSHISSSLQMYAAGNSEQWPAHAAELITSNNVPASTFLTGFNADAKSPIGNTTLSELESLSDEKQHAEIQAAVAALPKKVTSHRVGDFVFTYHGVPRTNVQTPFWVFIFWPENQAPQEINSPIVVGLLNGSTTIYNTQEFSQRLKEQNALRTNAGLPRLVPPQFVTHTQPVDPDCWVIPQ